MQVSVEGLNFAYRKKKVLDSVSFEINSGEIVGILGANGAGKSTLFRLLCGLLPVREGLIRYNSLKLSPKIKTHLGVVFQEASLDPKLTGKENLFLFAGLYSHVAVPMEIAGLDLDIPVKNLSGGMKRRLELKRVFLHQPQLVLMDEPTSGLDWKAFEEFWSDLRSKKATAILATHKAEEAERCDRLLILHKGQIILSESPQKLKERVLEDLISLHVKDPEQAKRILSGEFSFKIFQEETCLTIKTPEGHRLLPRLVEMLPKEMVLSVELRKPTLADAFLSVTGEALS